MVDIGTHLPPVNQNGLSRALMAVIVLILLLLAGVGSVLLSRPHDNSQPISPVAVAPLPPSPGSAPLASSEATNTHNPSEAKCVTCHVLPATHGQTDPFACAECHTYDKWQTAEHPSDPACSSCHARPVAHTLTSEQCSYCHKNAGDNWAFRHPDAVDCASCHVPPADHYSAACTLCHDPSLSWTDASFKHSGSLNCSSCHTPPHKSYPVSCVSCHPSVGVTWSFRHPADTDCKSCHTAPAAHYGSNCSVCHDPKTPWAATPLIHDASTTNCAECHTPPHTSYAPSDCTDCHALPGVAWRPITHPTNRDDCQTCHDPKPDTATTMHPTDCAYCHAISPAQWADGQHDGPEAHCSACHTPAHPSYSPSTCTDCHTQVGVVWLPAAHVSRTDCSTCHTPPASHYGTDCAGCHDPGIPWTDAAVDHTQPGLVCSTCHTPPHQDYAPTTCTDCHTKAGIAWTPIAHPTRSDCATCHANYPESHVGGADTCYACHAPEDIAFAGEWAYTSHPWNDNDCSACHDRHGTVVSVECASCHPATSLDDVHPATACDTCHESTDTAVSDAVTHGSAVCLDCHGATPHVHTPDMACATCHTPPHQDYAPSTCLGCHPQLGVAWVPTTHTDRTDCATCHAGTTIETHPFTGCESCHTTPVSYTSDGSHNADQVPTAAGCGGSGGGSSDCHNLEHRYSTSMGIWGSGPFSCEDCHSNPAFPNVLPGADRTSIPATVTALGIISAEDTTTVPSGESNAAILTTGTPTTGTPAPDLGLETPAGLDAKVDADTGALSWKAVIPAMSYEIQQSSSNDFSEAKTVWSGSATKADVALPTATDTVWFRVRAVDGDLVSGWSTPVRAQAQGTPETPSATQDTDEAVKPVTSDGPVPIPPAAEPSRPTIESASPPTPPEPAQAPEPERAPDAAPPEAVDVPVTP